MIFESENTRDKQWEAAPERFKHMRITPAPSPAPGENTRPAWPWGAFGDLEMREEERRDWEWLCDPDELSGGDLSEAKFILLDGTLSETHEILDLVTDLKKACPDGYLKMTLWTIAAAMDPRTPGVLN